MYGGVGYVTSALIFRRFSADGVGILRGKRENEYPLPISYQTLNRNALFTEVTINSLCITTKRLLLRSSYFIFQFSILSVLYTRNNFCNLIDDKRDKITSYFYSE